MAVLEQTTDSQLFYLFNRKATIDRFFDERIEEIKNEILGLEASYILKVGETEYIDYMVNEYLLDIPVVNFTDATSHWEEEREALTNRITFKIHFTLPFSGDYRLLEYKPAPALVKDGVVDHEKSFSAHQASVEKVVYRLYNSWGGMQTCHSEEELDALTGFHCFNSDDDEILQEEIKNETIRKHIGCLLPFLYVAFIGEDGSNSNKTANEAKRFLKKLEEGCKLIERKARKYHDEVMKTAAKTFRERKKQLLQNERVLQLVGLRIKPHNDLPPTYNIPDPTFRRSVTVQPFVPSGAYEVEPTLGEKVYEDILQTIFDVGKVMERLPSTYSNRREQELRDLFLLYLEPRYEGSATGETFNGQGKTDILIRHQNSNLFIAECKFWSGAQGHLSALTQLLKYVTWRDTKTSMIIFAQTKELSHVLTSIREATPQHPNYIKLIDTKHDTWFDYRLHMNGDHNREVMLNILVFHFPSHLAVVDEHVDSI